MVNFFPKMVLPDQKHVRWSLANIQKQFFKFVNGDGALLRCTALKQA